MTGFNTESGSTYTVDAKASKISGGVLGDDNVGFTFARIIEGTPAQIRLVDGRVIKTSKITKIL